MSHAAEFFAGMGLVRRALERTGWTVAWANDFDPRKKALYDASFPQDGARGSAHPFDGRDLREVAASDIPPCDLWTASFPCTDLSVAGARGGIHAGQSGAVWALLGLLEATPASERPRRILFENVMGLLSSHAGQDLRALVGELNRLGYGVDPFKIDAAWFTPQSRPRLLLVATPLDEMAPVDPQDVTPGPVRHANIVAAMRAHADLRWHAREAPPPPARRVALEEVLEDVPPESALWWPEDRAAYFWNQIHPKHLKAAEAMRDGERITRATAFRRVRRVDHGEKRSIIELRTDGLAGCLRLPKGGSAKQIVLEAGRGSYRVRLMTPREAGRLQGVELDGAILERFSANDLLAGLGDAVCVPAIEWAMRWTETARLSVLLG